MIFKNTVVQKLKQEYNIFSKKWSSKFVFLSEKIALIFDLDVGTF